MSQPKNIIDTFNKKLYNTKVITFLLEVQMRKVELTVKENLKYLTIKKLIETNGNKKRASIKLGCTVRHIDRMIAGYKEKGKAYFIHGNRGRTPAHALSEEQKTEIEQLYLSKYYDCNYTVFTEFLAERENIFLSIDEVRVILRDKYILSPRSHKSTRKRLRKQLLLEQKRAKSKSEKEKIQANIVAVEDAHPRQPRCQYFGEEIQMDASPKIWFGNVVTHLHLAVDKGTKKVLFGWFEYEEITRAYFILLFNIIINYGIPKRIKTDNRTTFSNQENEVNTTQFGRICIELGIELITTSVATAKANIERENRTFKNRLIAELRHDGITNIDEANKYLNEVFIPKMNKKFSYEIDEKTSMMKQNNYSEQELNLIISERTTRIIDNASSIKFENKYYVPVNNETGEVVGYMKKTECIVILTYNAELWCKIENNFYVLVEIENRDTTMKKEIDNDKPIERKTVIPPKSHPWRKNMMLR